MKDFKNRHGNTPAASTPKKTSVSTPKKATPSSSKKRVHVDDDDDSEVDRKPKKPKQPATPNSDESPVKSEKQRSKRERRYETPPNQSCLRTLANLDSCQRDYSGQRGRLPGMARSNN